jgi:phosphate-selective porin OprO/OprP
MHRILFLALVFSWHLFSPECLAQSPRDFSADTLLISNVRPWDGAGEVGDSINILIAKERIKVVSGAKFKTPENTLSIDGGGRIVMGRLEVGGRANLLIVDRGADLDITDLAEPASYYLVVKNGLIDESKSALTRDEVSAGESTYQFVDASRFKVVTKPYQPWYVTSKSGYSIAFGGGVFMDRTSFSQNAASEEQVGDLTEFNSGEIRAFRIGVGGQFPVMESSWKYALVAANRSFDRGFDTTTDEEWTFYDWIIGIPVKGGAELKIGKQKENFSHDRLTILVDQQFMERAMELDGLLPSRNTGITLANNALDGRMTWSAGFFKNMFGDRDEPYRDSEQYIVRVTGVPYIGNDGNRMLHLGGGYRYSNVDSHTLRFRNSPEVYFSPDFVDTGEFNAKSARWTALEAGWRQGPFFINGEYVRVSADSKVNGDPNLQGYHITAAWSLTGESRGYDNKKGVFTKLIPNRPVIYGGPGALELVARYSSLDLTDGLIEGGEMNRWSIGLNWYTSSLFKATAQYGWINLDRFGLNSTTRVFQLRAAFLLGL